MPIVTGMASSHSPIIFQETYQGWMRWFELISKGIPQPEDVTRQDEACVMDWIKRRDRAFGTLENAFAKHAPEALIVVGGDQYEWFSAANNPNIMIHAGEDDIVGFHNYGDFDSDPPVKFWEDSSRFGVRLKVHTRLAEHLLNELVSRDFDVSISRSQNPQGRPHLKSPHALTRPIPLIMPRLQARIVPIIIKTTERSSAALTGERCIELGREIGRICAKLDMPIAIYGSGGMSHDPEGPLSGWVDQELDEWVLDCLKTGDMARLGALFSFRSAGTDSGTGELRTWLVAAGAMSSAQPTVACKVVDYFPAHIATVGAGWVLWEAGN
jgi:Catalytic LigB subunit of aromatic ring-opening dioxygenase